MEEIRTGGNRRRRLESGATSKVNHTKFSMIHDAPSVAFNLQFLQGKVGGETVVRCAASSCPRLYEAMLKTSAHIADRVPGKSQAKKQDMVTTPQFLHPAELVLFASVRIKPSARRQKFFHATAFSGH